MPKTRDLRVVYGGENLSQEQGIRCLAGGTITVIPYIKKLIPVRPVEFDIPEEARATAIWR